MSIISWNYTTTGQVGYIPNTVVINTDDDISTVTTAGFLAPIEAQGFKLNTTDVVEMMYGDNSFGFFLPTFNKGVTTLNPFVAMASDFGGISTTIFGPDALPGTYATSYGLSVYNPTQVILGAEIYLLGGASNLLTLDTNAGVVGPTYVTAATTGAPSGTIKKLRIQIDTVTYYIVASTVVS